MADSRWTLRAEGGQGNGQIDEQEVRRALALFPDPEHGVELRGLPRGQSRVAAARDIDVLVQHARTLADGASGVYWCLGPVRADMGHRAARKADVLARRWLLVDLDPIRPKDSNATEQEHEAAAERAEQIVAWLGEQGWPAPILADSGNGFHLYYRVNLPASDHSTAILKAVTYALSERFSDGQVEVDRKTHNPSRISKLPGTWARKSPASAERPHRMCRLLYVPASVAVVPVEALQALGGLRTGQLPEGEQRSPFSLTSPPGAGAGDRTRVYCLAALEREAARVALARSGTRNDSLNRAAFALGQLIQPGGLTREEVEAALLRVADLVGLNEDPGCGPHGVRATLDGAIRDGMASLRDLSFLRQEQAGHGPGRHQASANGQVPATPRIFVPDLLPLTDLLTLELPLPRWAVPGILGEGLTLLAGKPKLGKSWLALNLAITIAGGGTALGAARCVEGDVLYLALEDRWRRLQDRARRLLGGIDCAPSGRLKLAVKWARQHEGGLDAIRKWLVEAERPTLVIVDTWQKYRPLLRSGGNQYEQDYAHCAALKEVVDDHNASALLLHHTKKAAAEDVFDEVSGTQGIAGAADSTLILTRARNENEATLHMTGRDIEEGQLALEFDPTTFAWRSLGDARRRTESKVRAAIMAVFQGSPCATYFPSELAGMMDMSPDTVRKELWRMHQEGCLRKVGAKYAWPATDLATPGEEAF